MVIQQPDARHRFERFLAARGQRVATLTVPAAIDAMLAFYAEIRAEGCEPSHDGDMLLYQWGTNDWGGGPHFELDLTRQFIFGTGEDDDIWQLSLTFVFAPSPTFAVLMQGHRWCPWVDDLAELRAFIHADPAYAAAGAAAPLRIDLDYDCAG